MNRAPADSGAAAAVERLRAFWVPIALLVLAGVLLTLPRSSASPAVGPAALPAQAANPLPVRQPKLRPVYEQAGYTYHCSDCHKLIESPPETTRPLTQHREIELKHGMNTRCFNCHNRTNRDAFVDDWGREIPYDQPQLVCAKCHGPVYRDWLHGAHGRVNGAWSAKLGPQERHRCIECHDPHNPPFQPLHPAPAPQTWRMGDQHYSTEHGGVRDPLRIFRPRSEPAGADDAR